MVSTGNRSDKSKRAQPRQSLSVNAQKVEKVSKQQPSRTSQKDSISPSHADRSPTCLSGIQKSHMHKLNGKLTPRKSRFEPSDELCENKSPTVKNSKLSDFDGHAESPDSKRYAKHANRAKPPTQEGYKKMNKEPNIVTADQHRIQTPSNQRRLVEEKKSAHITTRTRVPSIAHNIRLQADLYRLNLKTREENMNKRNQLIRRVE